MESNHLRAFDCLLQLSLGLPHATITSDKYILEHRVRFELTVFSFCRRMRWATPPPVHIIFGADSGTRTCDLFLTKEVHYHCVISALAPLEGFEPPTPSFVAKYSSPLSYRGINCVPFFGFYATAVSPTSLIAPDGSRATLLSFWPEILAEDPGFEPGNA